MKKTYDIEQLHYYASLFSGSVVLRSLKYNDNTFVHSLLQRYDSGLISPNFTYWDYLDYVYRVLEKNYCNEYVYKNTFITEWLIKEFSLKDTIAFSEFRIGAAIADLVLLNGASKAFEIKTELDSDKRLISQLEEYSKLMEECYIVVPEEQVTNYLTMVDPLVGVLAVKRGLRSLKIELRRKARRNTTVDIDVLMSSVWCDEYKWMTKQAFGSLPEVSCFEMFDACKDMLGRLQAAELHCLFREALKKRKNITRRLKSVPRSARQFCLAMDLSDKNFAKLNELYSQPIHI